MADYGRRCKEAQFDAAAAADAVALSREQATHDERLRLGAATLTIQDNYEYRTAISHNEQAKAARSSAPEGRCRRRARRHRVRRDEPVRRDGRERRLHQSRWGDGRVGGAEPLVFTV